MRHERVEQFALVLPELRATRWQHIEHGASADGEHWRVRADDESIVETRSQRLLQPDLRQRRLTRREGLVVHEEHTTQYLASAVMHVHARTGLEHLLAAGAEIRHARVEAIGDGERIGSGDDVAATDLGLLHARDVERHALARVGLIDGLGVHLHTTNARAGAAGHDLDRIVSARSAGPHGAGHDRARTGDGEDAIDGQTHGELGLTRGRLVGEFVDSGEQVGKSRPTLG